MIRGSTPTYTFKLPFDVSVVKNASVAYGQNDVVLFEKKAADCAMQGDEISVTLTQEETLKFDCHYNGQAQLKVLTNDGRVLPTRIYVFRIEKCLSDEVLG